MACRNKHVPILISVTYVQWELYPSSMTTALEWPLDIVSFSFSTLRGVFVNLKAIKRKNDFF